MVDHPKELRVLTWEERHRRLVARMLLALGLTPAYPNRTVETDPVGEVTTITVQGTRGGRQTVATAVVVTQP